MPLQPSQVVSRSNSDLLRIDLIAQNVSLSPGKRMAAILKVAQEWDHATAGSTERYKIDSSKPW